MQRPPVKIRILNEVYMMVVGLHGRDQQTLYEKFGVFAPNYFFAPTFKLGRWDGKIRYFHKDGKTFLYLIEEILPLLKRMGYAVTIEDNRQPVVACPRPITGDIFSNVMHLDTGKPIVLRVDQVQGVNSLIEHGNGICVAGTGCGKTLMCAALAKSFDNEQIKTLTIVPDSTLIKQTRRDYEHVGLDTGEYSGSEKTLDHQHVVSTWQALKNNPNVVLRFGMIIVDECHGLKGNVLTSILTEHAARIPHRFGFTGTLPDNDADKTAVHVAVGPVRHSMSAHELIEQGILSSLDINMIRLHEDLNSQYEEFCKNECIGEPPSYDEFKRSYFPDFSSEKAYLQRNTERLEWIADLLLTKQDAKQGNVLCLVDSIPVARKLGSLIPESVVVNGTDMKSVTERQKIYELFKTRDDLIVIATVHVAGTGLSINRIFNLVLVDIGKSFIRVIQAIGRGLRKAHDKDHVEVIDICSDLKYSREHSNKRINYYKEAKYPHKKCTVHYIQDTK